jgi:dolichol-phosphate mannosyltransferase
MIKHTIILPTYNEKENINEMIDKILANVDNVEIIVSDDNSPDKTWEIVKDRNLDNVRVIRRFKNKGVAPAIYDAIKIAKGDNIIWMDADLSMPPEMIPKMINALKKNDIAVGSRYIKGGKDKRSLVRIFTSRAVNLFANIVLNFKVLDYDSGFVAVKKIVFNKIRFNPKGHGEYCIEFLYKAGKKGYKIKEIPFKFTERTKGKSKSNQYFHSILKYGWVYGIKILSLRFKRV